MMDGSMAEEKGDGRLTGIDVLCTCCVADLVTPFTWFFYASNVQSVSQCRSASMAATELDAVSCYWRDEHEDQLPSICSYMYRLTRHPRTES